MTKAGVGGRGETKVLLVFDQHISHNIAYCLDRQLFLRICKVSKPTTFSLGKGLIDNSEGSREGFNSESIMAPKNIVLAFDLYGTLLSTESIAKKLATHFGEEKANSLSAKWRLYQLEYTWRLNSMSEIPYAIH